MRIKPCCASRSMAVGVRRSVSSRFTGRLPLGCVVTLTPLLYAHGLLCDAVRGVAGGANERDMGWDGDEKRSAPRLRRRAPPLLSRSTIWLAAKCIRGRGGRDAAHFLRHRRAWLRHL